MTGASAMSVATGSATSRVKVTPMIATKTTGCRLATACDCGADRISMGFSSGTAGSLSSSSSIDASSAMILPLLSRIFVLASEGEIEVAENTCTYSGNPGHPVRFARTLILASALSLAEDHGKGSTPRLKKAFGRQKLAVTAFQWERGPLKSEIARDEPAKREDKGRGRRVATTSSKDF